MYGCMHACMQMHIYIKVVFVAHAGLQLLITPALPTEFWDGRPISHTWLLHTGPKSSQMQARFFIFGNEHRH